MLPVPACRSGPPLVGLITTCDSGGSWKRLGVSLDTLPIQRLAICGREMISSPQPVEGEGHLGPPTNYNSNYSSVSTLSISALGHEGDSLGGSEDVIDVSVLYKL